MKLPLSVAVVFCVGIGCSATESGPTDPRPECGPNLLPYKTTCLPILDSCTAGQVAVPGGGCRRVGVEECRVAGRLGIKGPPDWTCKPVGPPALPACQPGWVRVRGGGCEPVLPEGECPDGAMPEIGEHTCQPVGDCGTGTYGSIKVRSATIYVDQSYTGTDADGGKTKPFTTIGEALAAAGPGGHVAVAAGTYEESPVLYMPGVTLEGRCPQKVTIKGKPPGWAAVILKADSVELRGLTISGSLTGILCRARGVVVADVVVRDLESDQGLFVFDQAEVLLRRVLVSGVMGRGMHVQGAKVTMERSVIQNTRPGRKLLGDAVFAYGFDGSIAELVIRDSLFLENSGVGVVVANGVAEVDRSVVMGSHRESMPGEWKVGIKARSKHPTTLVVRDSLVAENRTAGVEINGAHATFERTVVRDSLPNEGKNEGLGRGITVSNADGPTTLKVVDCVLERNRGAGIWVGGGDASIERTVVRGTMPLAAGAGGQGIVSAYEPRSKEPAHVTVRDSLVEGNRVAGLMAYHSEVSVERTVIRDTRPEQSDGAWGVGVLGVIYSSPSTPAGAPASEIAVRDSLLLDNVGSGIYGTDASLAVERTVVRGSRASGPPSGQIATAIGVTAWETPSVSLTVKHCLVDDNWGNGIRVTGGTATIEGTVLRHGEPAAGAAGAVVSAGLHPSTVHTGSRLLVRDTVVENYARLGIGVFHSRGTLDRVAVGRVWPELPGEGFPTGIYVGPAKGPVKSQSPSSLELRGSVVAGTKWAGVRAAAPATVSGCRISGTKVSPDGEGTGVLVAGPADLSLTDTLVEGSGTSGLAFIDAGGEVRRSLFRDATFAVMVEGSADPKLDPSNVYEDNLENRLAFGRDLVAPPAPTLPPPPQIPKAAH